MDAAQFGEYLHLIGFEPTRCDLTALKTLPTRHMAVSDPEHRPGRARAD